MVAFNFSPKSLVAPVFRDPRPLVALALIVGSAVHISNPQRALQAVSSLETVVNTQPALSYSYSVKDVKQDGEYVSYNVGEVIYGQPGYNQYNAKLASFPQFSGLQDSDVVQAYKQGPDGIVQYRVLHNQ